jgi:hypothetical protein
MAMFQPQGAGADAGQDPNQMHRLTEAVRRGWFTPIVGPEWALSYRRRTDAHGRIRQHIEALKVDPRLTTAECSCLSHLAETDTRHIPMSGANPPQPNVAAERRARELSGLQVYLVKAVFEAGQLLGSVLSNRVHRDDNGYQVGLTESDDLPEWLLLEALEAIRLS